MSYRRPRAEVEAERYFASLLEQYRRERRAYGRTERLQEVQRRALLWAAMVDFRCGGEGVAARGFGVPVTAANTAGSLVGNAPAESATS